MQVGDAYLIKTWCIRPPSDSRFVVVTAVQCAVTQERLALACRATVQRITWIIQDLVIPIVSHR